MAIARISFFDFAGSIEFGTSQCAYPGGFCIGFYRDRQPTTPNGEGFTVDQHGSHSLTSVWDSNGVWAGTGFNLPSNDGLLHFGREFLNYNSFMCAVGIGYLGAVEGDNPPTTTVAVAASGGSGATQDHGPCAVSNGTYSISTPVFRGQSTYWAAILFQIDGTDPSDPPLLLAFLDSNTGFDNETIDGWTPLYTGVTPPDTFQQIHYKYGTLSDTISSDVVTDICERAGLTASQIDVSLLTNANIQPNTTVQGLLVDQPKPAAEILKTLMQAYFFDGCETGGKMKWVPRGLPAGMSIPESDLGLAADKAKLEESLAQEQDLPWQITVVHNDPVLDYQQNKQLKLRNTRLVRSRQNIVLQIPMTMDATWARQVAEKALYIAWLERSGYSINLWRAIYLLLDPTDVITFTYEGTAFNARITENTLGQGFVIELKTVSDNANNYFSSAPGGGVVGYTPAPLQIVGQTQLWLFDIPLLEDTDSNTGGTGFYFACGSTAAGWGGAVLYESSDDSTFTPGPTSATVVTFGFATTTLAAPRSSWEWDTSNTLTVKLSSGQFAGDTQLNVLNGSNMLLVGNPATGVFEILNFQNATQNTDGTWTIDTLLRGRRGSEAACSSHGANELVILISSAVEHEPDPLSSIGQLGYYKAVTVGQDPSTAGAQSLTIAGNDLKPYAPCHIGGTVDGSGNITITWLRRTRIGGEADWADGVADVPLSEDAELYDVEIMNGSSVARTFTGVQVPTCVYTAAQQTADFGGTQSSVTVRVYQKSAQVGRGSRGTGAAPTAGGWPLPAPAATSGAGGSGTGQFYVNGS